MGRAGIASGSPASVESLAMLRICFGIGALFFHVTQFYTFFLLDPAGAHFYFMEPVWYFELPASNARSVLAIAGFALLGSPRWG
jgi:hypothetical protein